MRVRSTIGRVPALLVAGFCVAAWLPLGAPPAMAARQCGKERWAVKTGTDAGAAQADLTHPRPTTIADLVKLPKPAHWSSDLPRMAPVETTAWVITALLTDYKIELEK